MAAFKLFTSNRLEILADALADDLRTPLASPLEQEVIVVQSKGMERWVSMQLAKRHGICANYRFPFPNRFVREVFGKIIPGFIEPSPFNPEILTWHIMKLLPSCINRPGFEIIKSYLKDMEGDLKRFQLSERIADIFDQYLLFRPEMIFQWEKGRENNWQAILWRELVKKTGNNHRAAQGKAFFDYIRESPSQIKELPERVSIFGISAFPRFHMEIFAGIARITRVSLFIMNPCREYWGDILSGREVKKRRDKVKDGDISVKDLHLEKGNSLLGSLGTLGRDFFDLINEFPCDEMEYFKDPEENNMLSYLQSHILNLREPGQNKAEKEIIKTDDSSIQIHSCHGPMREIEVLHDRLLHMFEKDPGLIPGDILVMAPDIETYAPYIRAVFDRPNHDAMNIPFNISDRNLRRESEIIGTFLTLLDLQGSRFSVSEVLAIMESPAVRRRFGLSDNDIELIRKWVKDTRIRWGIDGQNRGRMNLPPFEENTWKAGMERLILGYAMMGEEKTMFKGILPYDNMEGGRTSVLGNFMEFMDHLFTRVQSLDRARALIEWAEDLTEILELFFMPDEGSEMEMQIIRNRLNDLGSLFTSDGQVFDEEIDINAVKWHLSHSLEKEGLGFGFLTGGVTFCAMLPMRSIPFKVICLLGMNHDAYPRESKALGFDLMAKNPKPGDRSRRNDDRYLFLEAMLSARKTLYISYVGQSILDNSPAPPSVLVSELTDYIKQGFEIPGKNILDHVLTTHRLQAFSPEYFKKNERLFSYSRENLETAERLLKDRLDSVPFIDRGLKQPADEWKSIDLEDLCSFFVNPSRFLLSRRLGIHLEEGDPIPEEREAFHIKGLEKYLLEKNMVERRLAGGILKDFFPLARASGQLPHGTVGDCLYDGISREVEIFSEKTAPYIQDTPLEPVEVDLIISDFILTGRISSVYRERLIRYRYARIKPQDRLKTWIYHLALNSVAADNYPLKSLYMGLNPVSDEPSWMAVEYSPVENGKEALEYLLETYWTGLTRPLRFFPESSWEYVKWRLKKGKPAEDALNRALKKWAGNEYIPGECEDAYYHLCFKDIDPIDAEFQQISAEIFGPMMEHQDPV